MNRLGEAMPAGVSTQQREGEMPTNGNW